MESNVGLDTVCLSMSLHEDPIASLYQDSQASQANQKWHGKLLLALASYIASIQQDDTPPAS